MILTLIWAVVWWAQDLPDMTNERLLALIVVAAMDLSFFNKG